MKRVEGQRAGEEPAGMTVPSRSVSLASVSCLCAAAAAPAPCPLPRLC